jgi:parvulin-like peptidyl-prolyl isomerase
MPSVGPPEAIGRRLSSKYVCCRQAFTSLASINSTIRAGVILALVLVVVGCGIGQRTVPAAGPTALVLDPTAAPAEASPPAAVEAGGGPTQDGHPLAARVNGQPIFLEAYEKQVAQTEQALIEQGLILEGEEGQAQLAQIRQHVLNGLVEQALIEQAAAGAGISVTDGELEATVQESITMGQGQESFDQWLAENDLTLDEFREIQRSQLLASKMIEHVTALVPTTGEQVHARHILTSDPTKAQAMQEELSGGANFAALAQQSSEDISTAANGGDLGWFPRDVPLMPSVVVEVAFALEAGGTSGVIESDQGYHIIRVEAREQNRPLTPEMVLYVRQEAFETWLAEQRGNAVIERYIDM